MGISAWPYEGDEDGSNRKIRRMLSRLKWIVIESVKKRNQDRNRASLIINSTYCIDR